MKTEEYQGFTLKADRYLEYSSSHYWEILKGEEVIACTLWNDDKFWKNDDEALFAAKGALTLWLSGRKDIYFQPNIVPVTLNSPMSYDNEYERRYPGNAISPLAWIHPDVVIGRGNTIGPFCMIGGPAECRGRETQGRVIIGFNNIISGLVTIDSGTDDRTKIGNGCYLMKHSHIGHDCFISWNVTLSCGAKIGGHSEIRKGANIGLNAVIHQHQIIAEGVMIGMGAVVTKKLITHPYMTYAGNPAKEIGDNSKHPNYTIFLKDSI